MNTAKFQRIPNITGRDEEDTAALHEMAEKARNYITSFKWCPPISASYLGYGIGPLVAVFLFQFTRKIARSDDDSLWVVVGDLPNAYMVAEPDDSPAVALDKYCDLMEDWISAVLEGRDLKDVYPVEAAPTAENADLLQRRVALLLSEIIPDATHPEA